MKKIIKNYNKEYNNNSSNIVYPPNIITKIFLSRFSPINFNFKGKKILDYSCGSGPYFNLFLDLKFRIYATEISDQIINKLKKRFKNIEFSVANNNRLNFSSNFFDIVFCNHSIYYLENENDHLSNIVNSIHLKLKKYGYLICTFPKLKQDYLKFKLIKKNIFKISSDKYGLRKGEHFYLFRSTEEIKAYFRDKFKIVSIGSHHTIFNNLGENYYVVILQKK